MKGQNEKNKTKNQNVGQFRALATVDERGQMVLTKDVRKDVNLHGGDKLAVFTVPDPIKPNRPKIVLVKMEDVLDQNVVSQITGS